MSNNLPPDLAFVQKATAIVKAAGMDPRAIDLESFRKWAPLIFTRAYCAIYKKQLISDLTEFSSSEEQILNSQLVIDDLLTRTRNPILASISGIDIFQGNHKAIGILVGVLFGEGQRMWLEKSRRAAPPPPPPEASSPPPTSPTNPESPSDVPREELDKLLHRIHYLEMRLGRRKEKRSSPASRAARSRPGSARAGAGAGTGRIREEDSDLSNSDGEQEQLRVPHQPESRRRPHSSPGMRRPRPTSASSAAVAHRLYNAPLNRHALENLVAAHMPPPPKPVAQGPGLFTYDPRSGRRITLAQAQLQREEQRRRKEAAGRVMAVSALDDELMGGGGDPSRRDEPVRPAYPCERIAKSVQNWLQKVRPASPKAASMTPSSPSKAPGSKVFEQAARVFGIYQRLQTQEVILSVEHCHDCAAHSVSLRHDPAEYVHLADQMLKHLAQEVLASGVCVRLGVARLEADFRCTKPGSEGEDEKRYGAFEVQAACKVTSGEVRVEVLHSKLLSRRWPSKSVLAKRLRAFLANCRLPLRPEVSTAQDVCMATEEGQSFPSGACSWSDTPLADQGWSFARFLSSHPSGPRLQLVFDGREVHDSPMFDPGCEIWVKGVSFGPHCTEPHPLRAVVDKYQSSSSAIREKELLIKLKYSHEELVVKEKDCLRLSDYRPAVPSPCASGVPWLSLELEGALLLAHAEHMLHFKIIDSGDKHSSLHELELQRFSFFQQLRASVWKTVQHLRSAHTQTCLHPVLAQPFDIHAAYSEPSLDLICQHFGSHVNVAQLLDQVGIARAPSLRNSILLPPNPDSLPSADDMVSVRQASVAINEEKAREGPSSFVTAIQEAVATAAKAAQQEEKDEAGEHLVAPPPAIPSDPPVKPVETAEQVLPVVDTEREAHKPPALSSRPLRPVSRAVDEEVLRSVGEALCASFGKDRTGLLACCKELRGKDAVRPAALNEILCQHGCDVLADSSSALNLLARGFRHQNKSQDEDMIDTEAFVAWLLSVSESLAPSSSAASTSAVTASTASDKNGDSVPPSVAAASVSSTKDTEAVLPSPRKDEVVLVATTVVSSVGEEISVPDFEAVMSNPPAEHVDRPEEAQEGESEQGEAAPFTAPSADVVRHDEKEEEEDKGGVLLPVASEGAMEAPEDEYNDSFLHLSQLDEGVNPADPQRSSEVEQQPPQPAQEKGAENSDGKDGKEETSSEEGEYDDDDDVGEMVQNKDVVISSIVVEGGVLVDEIYNQLVAIICIADRVYRTANCLSCEKGSKRRTFNVTWGEIAIRAEQFENGKARLLLAVTGLGESSELRPPQVSELDDLLNTDKSSSHSPLPPFCSEIPLRQFLPNSFEVQTQVRLPGLIVSPSSVNQAAAPSPVTAATSAPSTSGEESSVTQMDIVKVMIHGHAHEAKEARTARILSMKPTDLISLKFDPIPPFEEDDLDTEGEEEGAAAPLSKSPGITLSASDLHRSLFPKASFPDVKRAVFL
eukprot:gene9442-10431_t